jgi:hypothetical protein
VELDALKRAVLDKSDKQFEQLVYAITKREFPAARRPMAPESGADVLVIEPPDRCALAVQVKHYTTGRIAWAKCRTSFDDAVNAWSPERFRFAFPFALSGRQLAKFNAEFASRHPDVIVELFDLTNLHDALLDNEDLARRYFPRLLDPTAELARRLTQQAKQGNEPLTDAVDALDRGLALGEFINENDPNFEYQTVIQGPSQRPASFPDLPYATLHERRGDEGIQLVAWPREEADPGLPGWKFADDEAGEQARKRVEREVGSGRAVTILDGIRIRLAPAPVRVREVLERLQHRLDTEDGWETSGGLTLTPGDPVELTLGAGDAEAREGMGLRMYAVPPRGDHTYAWAGHGDAIFAYFGLTLGDSEATINLVPEIDLGRDASTNLAGLDLMIAILKTGAVTVAGPLVRGEDATITFAHPSRDALLDRLRFRRTLTEAVARVEEAANTKLAMPTDISPETAQILLRLGPLLGDRVLVGRDFETTAHVVRTPQLPAWVLRAAERRRITLPLRPVLFGREIDLGAFEIEAEQKLTLTVTEQLGPTLLLDVKVTGATTLRMVDPPGSAATPSDLGVLWTP